MSVRPHGGVGRLLPVIVTGDGRTERADELPGEAVGLVEEGVGDVGRDREQGGHAHAAGSGWRRVDRRFVVQTYDVGPGGGGRNVLVLRRLVDGEADRVGGRAISDQGQDLGGGLDPGTTVDVDVVDEGDLALRVDGEPDRPFLATEGGELLGGGASLEEVDETANRSVSGGSVLGLMPAFPIVVSHCCSDDA